MTQESNSPTPPANLSAGQGEQGPVIEVKDIVFNYDNLAVLHECSLSIPRGQITAIVGPSGCGKSTLLKLIAGLQAPRSGEIIRNYHDEPNSHPLSMVFQDDTLLPWLTTENNVQLFYRFQRRPKTPKAEVKSWTKLLLELVGLQEFADAYPYQLSGGMRRRVTFLTAVAARPQLLILDEPFSSVDEPTRLGIHQQVFDVMQRLKMTAILVTHDLAEALSLSQVVAVMSARPGQVASTFDVPFGEERTMLELRKESAFLELYAEVWDQLSLQIRRMETESGEDV
jgi:NitT/TauT family transport system ATP-binding protein